MKKDVVSIKGTINGLVVCIDSDSELPEITAELEAKIQARPGFFKEARFKIYTQAGTTPTFVEELEKICSDYGMIVTPDIVWPYIEKPVTGLTNQSHRETAASNDSSYNAALEVTATSSDSYNGNESSVSLQDTLLIQKNLRSGQKLHYNGNLVILGDVNPGAEISAGGDIIVMGILRGIAHAGAYGNENAVILAYRLEPTQLRIADKITRPPEKDDSPDSPELARLSQGQMFIEPYRSQRTNWEALA